jgi:inner membrane protein
MDNVCHTLVGAALGRAGLARGTRWGSAALMVAANVPDLDVLVFATGTPSVAFRRGWTHGVLAQAVLPFAVAAACVALDRWRPAPFDGRGERLRARPLWLVLLGYVGVYSHVGLDYLNNYGVRLLTPVDWSWFYGDAVFIVDPWLWATLALGVWWARRLAAPRPAQVALVAAGAYITAMLWVAGTARADVARQWTEVSGRPPAGLMVGPVPVVPWTREVIIDTGDEYRTGRYRVASASLELSDEPVPKNADAAGVAEARRSPGVAAFLVWSRFPFWRVETFAHGQEVSVGDMRFRGRTIGGFGASTLVASPARRPAHAGPTGGGGR